MTERKLGVKGGFSLYKILHNLNVAAIIFIRVSKKHFAWWVSAKVTMGRGWRIAFKVDVAKAIRVYHLVYYAVVVAIIDSNTKF